MAAPDHPASMGHDLTALQNAASALAAERGQVGNSTAVLEAIINQCSRLAREALRGSTRNVAVSIRSAAIARYASSKTDASSTGAFLEEAIAKIENEAKSQRTRASRRQT